MYSKTTCEIHKYVLTKQKMKDVILEKVISGGQTGADIAALHAVRAHNEASPHRKLQTGGYCPHDYATTKGRNAELAQFGLQQVANGPLTTQYALRSQLNVQATDATLAFRFKPSVGTDKTISYAMTQKWMPLKITIDVTGELYNAKKPTFVITSLDTDHDALIDQLAAFLAKHHVHALNVCGHRDECYERDIATFLQHAFHKFFKEIKE